MSKFDIFRLKKHLIIILDILKMAIIMIFNKSTLAIKKEFILINKRLVKIGY